LKTSAENAEKRVGLVLRRWAFFCGNCITTEDTEKTQRNTKEVKIPTLSHKTRQGWGILGNLRGMENLGGVMQRNFGRAVWAIVLCGTLILSGCSSNWISEAEQIVAVLLPAAANLVTLVAAMQGKTVSAGDLATIQNAGKEAGADLQLIQSLIAAYDKADAAARPGILNQIQSAIGAVQGNLQGLLMGMHIKDAATQAKVTAVVGLLLSEVQSLAAVLPVVQGNAPAVALRAADSRGRLSPHFAGKVPLPASEFVRSYNSTLTAKTGNAALDQVTGGLQIHLHSRVERVASAGMLK
jgi:hypothetical protein